MHTTTGLAALSILWTSCTGSGGSTAVVPLDARTISVEVPSSIQGDVKIAFTISSTTVAAVDVLVEVTRDGGTTWHAARVYESLTGLATSAAGTRHECTWDTLRDVGFRDNDGLQLRVVPYSSSRLGAAKGVAVPSPDNRAIASRNVDNYMIHYGVVDDAVTKAAEKHDLVVLHPLTGKIPVSTIREIQDGVDPADPADDVLVLAYISIGEDLRTVGVNDDAMRNDPRFVGDGSGPRIDPRGPNADGQSLVGVSPLGAASNGGTGYASWYLDDNDVDRSPTQTGNGKPDRNAHFGGCFVNAGDPAWFDVLDAMTFDGPDRMPGMRELLTATHGRGYACDGLFLDTIDTCAPNSYTDSSSTNQSEFEWTAPGFAAFIARLAGAYPGRLILQNRGLFFYDPRHPHYAVNPRSSVDFLMFESYRLNSNTFETYNPYYYADNKHNVAPKLLAEANRHDGFRIVSLGYAEGPTGVLTPLTLTGQSQIGFDILIDDIRDARGLGFLHYLSNAAIDLPNTFAGDHDIVDVTPPVWSSTYNDNDRPWPEAALAPTPRIGIQEIVSGPNSATLRWDVAVDQHRVGFCAYYQTTPFDFDADPDLANATKIDIDNNASATYVGIGPGIFANEATIQGLESNTTHWFCIRAHDSLGHEEKNRVSMATTPLGLKSMTIDGNFSDWTTVAVAHSDPADVPDSAGPDWLAISYANDKDNLYVRFTSENAFNLDGTPTSAWSRYLVFFDCDNNASTGYAVTSAVGSELLVTGESLYKQKEGVFNDGLLSGIAIAPKTSVTQCEFAIPLSYIFAIAPGATKLRALFVNDDVYDYAPNAGFVEIRLVAP
ncbi:MAG: hypothetical protein H6832_15300 [Planctomycetes bacterium]|nr:hypothetical protein [Planctomycetota bacterium]MCB9919767.1 hypothetical protein [Planctomycetota bacterium]